MPVVPPTPRVELRSSSRRVPRVRSALTATVTDADSEPNMRLSRAIMVMLLLHVVAVGGIFAFSYIKEKDVGRASKDQNGTSTGFVEAEDSVVPVKNGVTDATRKKTAASPGPAHPSIHVVRAGETLTRIANDHGVTLEALVAVNGASTVTNGLHPGQELKLPDKSPEPEHTVPDSAANALDLIEGRPNTSAATAANATPSAKNGHLPPDSGKVYVVGKGESPYVIAQKLKVSYDALLKLNQIDDPKKLKPGQKLRIPSQVKPKGKKD